MSAFLCTPTHTWAAALITLGTTNQLATRDQIRELAVRYRALNNYALRARYGDAGVPLDSGATSLDSAIDWIRTHTPADCYQVLACLQYQCSEGACEKQPGWATLAAACKALEHHATPRASQVWSI